MLDQLLDSEVPYLSFSGGEPMLHPHFFAMVERACERGAQLKIETNAPLSRSRECRAPEGARRQGGPGEPRRRLDRDLRPHARARRVRSRPRRRAQPARRGRADRDQLLAGELQHARGRRRGRPRLRARRLQLLHRPDDVHRQCRQGLAPPRGDRGAVRRVLRRAAREDRGVPRTHARLLPRGRAARGAALSHPAPGGLADRAAQRPGQAHQRPALHLRRLPARQPRRRSGPASAARGTTRGSHEFVEDLAADPGKTRTLHQWVYL